MASSNVSHYKKILNRQHLPLPYDTYEESHGIYIMNNGGFSMIFECKPYGGFNAEAGLTTAISCLPEHASMQFLLIPNRNITPTIDKWKASKNKPEEIYQLTRDNYANFLEEKTKDIVSVQFRSLVSEYVLLVTISIGGREKEQGIFGGIMNYLTMKDKDDTEEMLASFKLLADTKNRLQASLQTANLFPEPCKPDRLIELLYPILNPNHDPRLIPGWLGNMNPISDQLIANDNEIEVFDDYFKMDDMYYKSLSVKDFPKYWHCGRADHLIGHPFGQQSIESTTLLCLNVVNIGKSGIAKIKRNMQIILSQNLSPALFPRLQYKKQDLTLANDSFEKGEQPYHVNFAIITMGKNFDNVNNVAGQIKSYYQGIGFKLEEDKYINLPIMLSILPGNYDERFKNDLGRGYVVFHKNAVDLAPSAADWGGNTATPEVFFLTPRGQLFCFDLFASNTNYNGFFIGTSGAGKSVALQYLAMNYMMSGARVNIIDIGGSYKSFCEILGGQYVDIMPEAPISLNPFTELTEKKMFDEYKEFLSSWYWMMGSPESRNLSEEQSRFIISHLNNALERSYEKYGTESDVDTVIECFLELVSEVGDNHIEDIDIRCKDFVQVLSQYGKKGLYGAFFNGRSEIEFKSDIVVLETGSMENSPQLRDPILMILTYHISKSIYLTKDMSRKNLIIIDEAHKFLGNYRVDGFVEQAYRRFRKHNASIIIGTQGWEDLADEKTTSKAGRVIIDNSEFQIFMAQSPASAEKLKGSTSHNFNDYEKGMIDSIAPVKGEYSEAMIVSGKNKVKIRILLDKWMQKIFFTTPAMRTYIYGEVAKGKSFRDAIENMPDSLIK